MLVELSPEGELEAHAGTHKYGYDGNWKFQMENGVDGYHPNFVHRAFFDLQGKDLGRKVSQLFTENSSCESKDLGNGHSILNMAPQHRPANQPMPTMLRGKASQESSDAYLSRMIRRCGEQRACQIFAASNATL